MGAGASLLPRPLSRPCSDTGGGGVPEGWALGGALPSPAPLHRLVGLCTRVFFPSRFELTSFSLQSVTSLH